MRERERERERERAKKQTTWLFPLDKNGKVFENEVFVLNGKENSEVKNFFRDNFDFLFRDWTLLTKQKGYVIQHGEWKGEKPDDLAFHEEEKTLWVIEYKSVLCEGLFTQALSYMNALKEPVNRYHVWEEYLRKHDWEVKDIERVKAICIIPAFDRYQKGAENEQIALVKFTKYQNETHSSVRLESKYFDFPSDEIMKLENHCQQLEVSEWVNEKTTKIDDLVSSYNYQKQILEKTSKKMFVVYKRKTGKWVLLIRIGKTQFRVWFENNEITRKLNYEKDNWFKNLRMNITCKDENEYNYQNYQNCCKILVSYLNFMETILTQ